MANALGELFADVAYEIKVKRGEDPRTVKYKPTEFAEKISEISVGIDTSNATATEYDMAQGATAWVNGEKITGALEVLHTAQGEAEEVYDSGGSVKMSLTNTERAIYDSGTVITVSAPLEEFGDATAEDVAVGKTFTSADGMLVVGTGASSGGGGGSSEDVRYVTFMSHDGTEEYGKKAVAVGDDCADPIARGVFDTPTRESTAQYNYTFVGWATTVNGALDSNALKAVGEDRTVYANFAAVTRYYTITYYDSDGSTVLKTQSLAYGSTPSYTPEKDGYTFDSWNPNLETVTGDASYTAVWIEKVTFAGGTWEDIIRIAESGNAANVFTIGDTKTVTLYHVDGKSYSTKLKIVGFNHDDLADGTGKAGISIVALTANAYAVLDSDGNYSGGWAACSLRNTLNNTTINSFPSALKNSIKSVVKSSRVYTNGTATDGLVTSNDKLWIPSLGELGVTGVASGYGYSGGDGNSYAGLSRFDIISGVISSSSAHYWTRSGSYKNKADAIYISATTNKDPRSASVSTSGLIACVFGFCI